MSVEMKVNVLGRRAFTITLRFRSHIKVAPYLTIYYAMNGKCSRMSEDESTVFFHKTSCGYEVGERLHEPSGPEI